MKQHQRLWVGLDQIASSATSFGCSALAAGLLSAPDFGAWAVAFTIGILALTSVRTWSGDALMIVTPGGESGADARVRGAAAFAFGIGILISVALIVGSAVLRGSAQAALTGLAIGLPLILVQDVYRFALLARRQGEAAFANDLLWLVLSTASLIALRRANHDSVMLSMMAWSVMAAPSVVLGAIQTGSLPDARAAVGWVRSIRHLSSRLFAEYAVFMASSLIALTLVIGIIGDIELAGSLRGAQVLMGPLTVLLGATTMYLQPRMVIDHSHGRVVLTHGRSQSLLLLVTTAVWTGVLLLVPDSIGTRVFGFTWFGAEDVLIVVGIVYACSAVSTGAINVLRCTGRVGQSLAAHAVLAVIVGLGTLTGSLAAGSDGAVIGFAVCSVAGPVLLWYAALRTSSSRSRSAVGRSRAFRRGPRVAEPQGVPAQPRDG